MNNDADAPKRPVPIVFYTWLLVGVWTAVVFLSLVWEFTEWKASTLETARILARGHYEKDLLYRRWNALAGGVYVPVSEKTPPNPYLSHVSERDIATPSGRVLTLVNPAYMGRQVHGLAREKHQVWGHITSLKPIRPENFPDAWETAALQAFEKGTTEVSSVEELDGQPFLRLMRPFTTEKSCLGCHAKQGYKLGDIRGGISVSVPMRPLWSLGRGQLIGLFVGHGFVWLLGTAGIFLGGRRLRRSLRRQEEAEEGLQRAYGELENRVQERTAELTRANESLQTEIAERQRAEAALRNNESFLSNTFSSIQDGLCVLDSELNIVRVNPAMERWYAHALPLVGQKCYEAYHRRSEPCQVCPSRQTLETGKVASEVIPKMGAHGEVAGWLEVYSFQLVDTDSGKMKGVINYIRDITEHKQAEEALRQSEEQLRQAVKMEAVGRLAGGVAHDFNNILTGITGYCELLLMDFKDHDSRRQDMEEIKNAAERAASLTRQLLAFSRKQMLQMQPLDLNVVVANMDRMLKRIIGEDIELATIPAPGPAFVKADPGQMEQVILNLAVNAREAMPRGGKLTVETANLNLDADYTQQHLEVKAGPYVMLAISDTGSGLDKETQSRIFEPFFTTKEPGQGTGLGLATVYGIIKQSGGHIYIYSEPGQGTTFKIYLPRLEDAVASAPVDQATTAPVGGPETILLVEDEDMVRQVVRRILEERLHRERGRAWDRGPAPQWTELRSHPSAVNRCGDARDERPGVGGPFKPPTSGNEGSIYVRPHRECHRAPRGIGSGNRLYPETLQT